MKNAKVQLFTVPIPQTKDQHSDILASLKFLQRMTTEERLENRWQRMLALLPSWVVEQLQQRTMASAQLRHGIWSITTALTEASIDFSPNEKLVQSLELLRKEDVSTKEILGDGLFRLKDLTVDCLRKLWKAPARHTMTIRLATYDEPMSRAAVLTDWKERGFQSANLFQKLCFLATDEGKAVLPTIHWDQERRCCAALVCLEPLSKTPLSVPILMEDECGLCLRPAEGEGPGWRAGTRFVAVT